MIVSIDPPNGEVSCLMPDGSVGRGTLSNSKGLWAIYPEREISASAADVALSAYAERGTPAVCAPSLPPS